MTSTIASPASSDIEPIDREQREKVVAETERYIHLARGLFDKKFGLVPVFFDLSGRASGMYKVRGRERCIRYNPYIFALQFDEHLSSTVAHEVGHYVADKLYGLANIKPHGREWQGVMARFGADASRTFTHSLEGVPQRQHRQVTYFCACGSHQLGIRRHNKVRRGLSVYHCKKCRETLTWSECGPGAD